MPPHADKARLAALMQDQGAAFAAAGLGPISTWPLTKTVGNHRPLDHHLTSLGRYGLAARIAARIEGDEAPNLEELREEYAKLERQDFPVFEPSGRAFVTEDCQGDVDALAVDEHVILPDQGMDSDALFGDPSPQDAQIILAGTSQGQSANGNLADFLGHFTGMTVANVSQVGGGAATALQAAAHQGLLTAGKAEHLVWEVSRQHDQVALLGAVLAARGMALAACDSPIWTEHTLSHQGLIRWNTYPAGQVLSLTAEEHRQGEIRLTFIFDQDTALDAQIWRWSLNEDVSDWGSWDMFLPDFAALNLPEPTAIQIALGSLYNDAKPDQAQTIRIRLCDGVG